MSFTMTGGLYRVLYKAGGGQEDSVWEVGGSLRQHYLWTGRCSPLRGVSG